MHQTTNHQDKAIMTFSVFADLHNHTLASDGDFSPRQLVQKARINNISAIAITDHDTLKGLAQGLAAGKEQGVQVIPGVEVSVRFNRSLFTGTLHLLCYFLPDRLSDQAFVEDFEALLSDGRGEALVKARIARINKVFGPDGTTPLLKRALVFADIAAYSTNASRRHFALALSHRLGIEDKKTINQIIGNASPAYLPSGIALDAVADFIKKQDLLAVLAHPAAGSFPGQGHYKEVLPPVDTVEKMLPEFLAAGIRGIEVFYPGHTKEHRAILLSWAKTHQLLVTGGSDCHDDTERPPAVAGISQADFKRFYAGLS
ncbi:MAG: PHP domain-containing protein [Desulfobacteraceae bacterium]|nr:PHP domain-containing protein [Desulfobacteraceae bacterium]